MLRRRKKRVYLDYAAATPVDRRVMRAMRPYFHKYFANSSSIAQEGLFAHKAIEESRETIAQLMDARPTEIIFTNGGTESNNMAILGVIRSWQKQHPQETPHVVTTNIEHKAVRETCRQLQRDEVIELTELSVDEQGVVDTKKLKESLKKNTALVSVIYANNEIGTIQPIREITKIVRWFRRQTNNSIYPLVHTDAIQATNYCDMRTGRLGVDLMSVSSAKIYGPKGMALLYVRRGVALEPMFYGGGQEQGLRPGTVNTPLVVGFARAMELVSENREKETQRLRVLQNYFFDQLQGMQGLIINGSQTERLPNNINISVPNISGEQLVIELDARGVVCSAQSACSSLGDEDSYVVEALRQGSNKEEGTLRFTMGRGTTKRDIDYAIGEISNIIENIRATQYRFKI